MQVVAIGSMAERINLLRPILDFQVGSSDEVRRETNGLEHPNRKRFTKAAQRPIRLRAGLVVLDHRIERFVACF